MKKRILSLALLLAIALLSLASCFGGGNVASSGVAKIVIENQDGTYTEYSVNLAELENRNEGAISVLEFIASQENSTLYYNVQWGGGYGAYITSIGSLNPNPASEYISLYTTEADDFAVPTEYMPTVATASCGEQTLTYSGVGLSSMHINDGTIILFRLESFA